MSFEELKKDIASVPQMSDAFRERLDSLTREQFIRDIPEIMNHLNDKNKSRTISILRMKYALTTDGGYSVREIANHFHINTERVRESLSRVITTCRYYYSLDIKKEKSKPNVQVPPDFNNFTTDCNTLSY